MKSTYFLLIGCCFHLLSCKPKEANTDISTETHSETYTNEWAKSFLDSANVVFSQQLAAGDSVALASQYWPDAALLFSHMETVEGPGILGAWGGMIRSGLTKITFTTTDVVNDENFIIETGKYELKDSRDSLADKGNFVVIWQNRDGVWKLYRDTGITTMPSK